MWQNILKQNPISNIIIRGNSVTATYLDPKSKEKLKMNVNIHEDSLDGNIVDKEGVQLTRAFAEKIGDGVFQAKEVSTKSEFMRRGYAENLYHLIAYSLSNQNYDFVGDTGQSGEADNMWNKNSTYGSWDIPEYM